MRSILKKLPLKMLSPLRFSLRPETRVIQQVMSRNFQNEADAAIEKLKVETEIEIQKIVSNQNYPALVEINAIKTAIVDLYKDRQNQIEQRKGVIRAKAQDYNNKAERYRSLIVRYDDLKPKIDALTVSTEAEIASLNQETNQLATELTDLVSTLDVQLKEAIVIDDRINAYIESVNNGDEINAQEIQTIQDELNALIDSANQTLELEYSNLQVLDEQINEWLASQNANQDGLASRVDDAAITYNNFNAKVIERENTLDTYAADQAKALAYAEEANAIGDTDTYNYWVGVANGWVDKYDQEYVYYEIDLITLGEFKATYQAEKAEYESEKSRIEAELAVREAEYEREGSAYNNLADEKDEQINLAKIDADERIAALNDIIQAYIDDEEAKFVAIVNTIEGDFGPQYGLYLDLYSQLAQDLDWNAALNAINGLEREGHPSIQRSYDIISVVALKKIEINLLNSAFQSQLSEFNAIVQEINTLITSLEGSKPEIDILNEELAKYLQDSLGPIQELEVNLSTKEKSFAEEVGEKIQVLYALRDLQNELVRRQVLVVSSVFTSDGEETAALKDAYDQARDAVLSQDSAAVPIDVIEVIIAKSQPSVEEVLDVEAYQNQSILSSTVLADDEKTLTIKRWWNLLRRENALVEEANTLTTLFGQSEVDTWKFLDVLFTNGFFVEPAIEKVVFTEGERNGYRVVIDGSTYWLNEAGRLVASDDLSSLLFDSVFLTPASTEIGKMLREERANLRELFKSFEQYDNEKKNALVLAESLLREADRLESEADKQKFLNIAKSIGEIVIGITPAGDSIDAYECLTGTSIYGDPIGIKGQVLAAAGLIIGSRVFWEKTLTLLSKGFKKLQRIVGREASEITEAMVQEAKVIADNTPIPPIFKATGFTSADKLKSHFNKHAKGWGEGVIKTEAEYLERALALNNSKIEGSISGFTSPEGYVFRYNQASNEFAVATPQGLVQTFYKPDRPGTGLGSYYNDQVVRYAPKI